MKAGPNFVLVGGMKCGTTSLYRYLKGHPDCWMPGVKEPNYFALRGQKAKFSGPGDDATNRLSFATWSTYVSLFPEKGYRIRGEASAWYLTSSAAPIALSKHVSKVCAVLRDPVSRAYSAFSKLRAVGREPLENFEAAIEAEHWRCARNWEPIWQYVGGGLYGAAVRRYQDAFHPTDLHLINFDDLIIKPKLVLRELCRFLEIRESAGAMPWVNRTTKRREIDRKVRRRIFRRYFESDLEELNRCVPGRFEDWGP